MRVLLVTHRFPPFGVAGVERVAEQTALELTAAGDEVTVLTHRASVAPPLPRLQRSSHLGLEVLMMSGGGPLHGRFPKHGATLERLFERTLLDVDPDVVLICHLMDHSPAYVTIAHRWGVPVAFELHDYYAVCEQARLERVSGELCDGPHGGRACARHCFAGQERTRERWALRTHMFRRALEQADALVAPSQFVADYFTAAFGATIATPRVLGNGVSVPGPASYRRPAEGPLRIAYVGTVVAHKGVHVIVEALGRARLDEVELTLFGLTVEPYFGELMNRAAEISGLKIGSFGPYEPEQLRLLLTDIDLVIVPATWWETYSIVIREALACGIPVIASRLGALPEGIRDGENGMLFEAGSSAELAQILVHLDTNRDTLARLRAGIRPSDWTSVPERAGRMRELLLELATRRADARGAQDELDGLATLRDSLGDSLSIA